MTDEGDHHDHHRDVASGGARAAVFGMSDGLVTNTSLILGFAGAHPSATVVRLAGLAGLVAGACSMAIGELISMQAQRELLEYELGVERHALAHAPQEERAELEALYVRKGLSAGLAAQLATEVMANPELALEVHAREELGVDPGQLGSPTKAALASLVMFSLGAFLPLLPWLFLHGSVAVVTSVVLAAVGSVALGGVLGHFTGRSKVTSALRQLGLTAVAAAITSGIGHLVGAG